MSFTFVVIQIASIYLYHLWHHRQRGKEYVRLFHDDLLFDEQEAADQEQQTEQDEDLQEADVIYRSASITSTVNVLKDQASHSRLIPVTESITALAGIAITTTVIILQPRTDNTTHVPKLLLWVFLLLLSIARQLAFIRKHVTLWYYSVILYLFLWLLAAIDLRSGIIRSPPSLQLGFSIALLILATVLCGIALGTRFGNTSISSVSTNNLKPSDEPKATLISRWTFSWVDSIIRQGWKQPLEIQDVWDLPAREQAAYVLHEYHRKNQSRTLILRLFNYFKGSLLLQAGWAVGFSVLSFAPTVLLRQILEYLEDPSQTPQDVAWLYVIGLAIAPVLNSICNGQALWTGRKISLRLRAVIIGEVYSKALRRKDIAAKGTPIDDSANEFGKKNQEPKVIEHPEHVTATQANNGAIINLMAVDAVKVSEICSYLHYVMASVPIELTIALYLLYKVLGVSSLAGVAAMLLLLPLQYWIASNFNKVQDRLMSASDKRVTVLNELLQNVRVVKFFAWESMFTTSVNKARSGELYHLRQRLWLWAWYGVMWYGTPSVITMITFIVHTKLLHKELTAPIAFTALSLFNVLGQPLDQLADMVTNILQSKVSLDRVADFLEEEETEKYSQLFATSDNYCGFKHATFSWASRGQINKALSNNSDVASLAFQLIDIDVEFPDQSLTLVIGPTGSGKSSLLQALLGELCLLSGSVHMSIQRSRDDYLPDPEIGLTNTVAYCAQQSWLLNDSIRNNILFASPYNRKRYYEVIEAVDLQRDFDILEAGDKTEVGEKGITMSGGQKQRISLARALYCSAKYLLLDDCLSAVDSHTAQRIFENAINGPLVAGRTRILVTHSVSLCLPAAAYVVMLSNGTLQAKGKPMELLERDLFGGGDQHDKTLVIEGSFYHVVLTARFARSDRQAAYKWSQ